MNIFNSLGSNYKLPRIFLSWLPNTTKLMVALKRDFNASDVSLTFKGRQALYLALKQLELKEGDKVAINGYTCYAVYDAVVKAGLKPVYIDIQRKSLNMRPNKFKEAVKKHKIKAVIIQNTLGIPTDIQKIEEICKKEKIHIIEDLAHCLGMEYKDGRKAGQVGVGSILSFSQNKIIDSVSGGALIWNKPTGISIDKGVDFKQKFKDTTYPIVAWLIRHTRKILIGKVIHKGLTKLELISRPLDGTTETPQKPMRWQTRSSYMQYKNLDKLLDHRKSIAAIYRKKLPKDIQLPYTKGTTYIRFPIIVKNRQGLISHLEEAGVHVSDIWYDSPISPIRFMPLTDYKGDCPTADRISKKMLNLPTHIRITPEKAEAIAEEINKWL